jgi:lipopolysaccharide export system permease protein
MTFFIVLFLLLMQFLWRYIDDLVGKGLDFKIIAELMIYASSSLVPLALPLAVLLSSLMTFGNMGEYYELTALKSSGISLRRIMFPLVLLVILISVGAFLFSNYILPVTNLKMKSLLYDVRQQRPELQIVEGVFYNGIDDYSIRINKKDPVNNMLYDIKIYDHTSHKGNVTTITADSGQMKMTADRRNLIITLWSGYTYKEMDENRRRRDKRYPHELDRFGKQQFIIEMSGFELLRSDENIFRNSYQMLNVSQLKHATDSLKSELANKGDQFYKSLISTNYFKASPAKYNEIHQPVRRLNLRPINTFQENIPGAYTTTLPEPIRQPQILSDTLKKKLPLMKVNNFDSLFNSYSSDHQQNFIRKALTNTSMAQYLIVNSSSNIKYDIRYLRRHQVEWHRKFTLSFACLIFLFIGAPLGAIIRKGGLGMPTVISTILFILYYIISLTGEKFVRENVLPGFEGMWLSSFILVIAGVFLTYEATNDSAILNLDTYFSWLRDKLGFKKGRMLEKKASLAGKFDYIEVAIPEMQENFRLLAGQAKNCIDRLKEDHHFFLLAMKIAENSDYDYLNQFDNQYNELFNQVILSKWFRNPYFQKRLAEYPDLNSKVTSSFFKYKLLRILWIILFPVWISRFVYFLVKVRRLRLNIQHIAGLSAGMVNLLNRSGMDLDNDNS